MPKSIITIFSELSNIYKLPNFYLASGGLSDIKGPGTSDVDIVFITDDYEKLDHIFKKAKKEPRPDKKRCYYTFKYGGREVSICASNDRAALRSVTHRLNELMLNKFPLITACAINYKILGMKTEPAWATVLELTGDPYDAMMMEKNKLRQIAKKKEAKLAAIMKKLKAD